jgi:hypothetical protein
MIHGRPRQHLEPAKVLQNRQAVLVGGGLITRRFEQRDQQLGARTMVHAHAAHLAYARHTTSS